MYFPSVKSVRASVWPHLPNHHLTSIIFYSSRNVQLPSLRWKRCFDLGNPHSNAFRSQITNQCKHVYFIFFFTEAFGVTISIDCNQIKRTETQTRLEMGQWIVQPPSWISQCNANRIIKNRPRKVNSTKKGESVTDWFGSLRRCHWSNGGY